MRLSELDLKTSIRCLSDLFMPRTCLVCGRNLILEERHLCVSCFADLPRTYFERLSHNPLADRLNARFGEGTYAYGTALFHYGGPYCEITRVLKYRRNFSAGRYFAAMLGRSLRESSCFADVDMVVPVPLHWTRRIERGYNQAEVIAVEVARVLAVPCAGSALRRLRRTRSQALTARRGSRDANVAGAFATRKNALPLLKEAHHILLVDDVFTTGATLYACYEALRLSLGRDVRISVAALAYAGGR